MSIWSSLDRKKKNRQIWKLIPHLGLQESPRRGPFFPVEALFATRGNFRRVSTATMTKKTIKKMKTILILQTITIKNLRERKLR